MEQLSYTQRCNDRGKTMSESVRAAYDEVARCNRCGFCQAVCPVFDITKDERSVARGHNVHIRRLIEGGLEVNKDLKDPLFECLLCKACVEACFPEVRTDQNVIAARAEYMRQIGQPKAMAFLFRRLLLDHHSLARYVRLAAFGKNSGVSKLARALGLLKWFGRDLDKVEGIVERFPRQFFRERSRESPVVAAKPNHTLGYFVGCGFNFVLPQVSEATLDMLGHVGTPAKIADNCCCGLPAFTYGDLDAARAAAAKNIDVLEKLDADTVVTECGSCSSFLKTYPELFEDDPQMRARAERLAKRVQGFSEFIHDRIQSVEPINPLKATITYHDPCHMSRYQNIVKEPRQILSKLPRITYKELSEADRCCGAAGSYNIMHYEKSMRVLDRKMEALKRTGADILTTECPGCLIQLRYGVRRAGLPVRVLHISQLLREVYVKE